MPSRPGRGGGLSARDAAALSAFTRSVADRLSGTATAGALARLQSAAAALGAALQPPPSRVTDQFRTLVIDLVVVADEVNSSVAEPDQFLIPRAGLALSCRSLCGWLAERHPGRSVEVRVPPFAAVQCAIGPQGPTHTRGTPPNVVETDPLTFLRLATGRLDWAAARAAGAVTASGQRADLTDALPIHRVRSG